MFLAAGYGALAAASFVFLLLVPAGYDTLQYLAFTIGYGIGVAAVAMLATHLPPTAINAGVRRAFELTALGTAFVAVANVFGEVLYFQHHVAGGYKVGAAALFVGSSLLAIAYWLWSLEQAPD